MNVHSAAVPFAPGVRMSRSSATRRAFTLIEMLVSLAITLIMMGAVTSLFGLISDNVAGSRSIIEMSDRLRACRNRLQADLQGLTVTKVQPPLRPENDEGYLEIIEGPNHDNTFSSYNSTGASPPPYVSWSLLGDCDDVLMFTVRSRSDPFVGRMTLPLPIGVTTTESQTAEVMYYAIPNGPIIDATTNPNPTRLYTLYRRVLLVSPGLRLTAPAGFFALGQNFYDQNDISVHIEVPSGTPIFVPNTLGDLTKPECRFAHYSPNDQYPFNLNAAPNIVGAGLNARPQGHSAFLLPLDNSAVPVGAGVIVQNRTGDDVIMTNVLAFDVQVFDPGAPISITPSGVAVTPIDAVLPSNPLSSQGAYIDLGYSSSLGLPQFNFAAVRSSGAQPLLPMLPMTKWINPAPAPAYLNAALNPNLPTLPGPIGSTFTYDTWSLHYENDGIQQNTSFPAWDIATNGLDDVGSTGSANGIVDDITEYETLSPFGAQLRGLRVVIRVYEPSSKQVREVTVVQDFLPE